MSWIKIFISHSTKTAEAQQFLDAVKAALDQDFDVELDQTGLGGGDDWRNQIYRWLYESHGAVLLLTREALASNFVKIETAILSSRRVLQPDFILVPALIGTSVADLQQGQIGEMALDRFQAVSDPDPQALACKIVNCFQPLKQRLRKPRTAREALQDRIMAYLGKELGPGREAFLETIGACFANWPYLPGANPYETLTNALLDSDLAASCDAIRQLAQDLKGVLDLLDLIAPCWVKEEAAKPIIQQALSEATNRAISLNAVEGWTADAYISRSCYKSLIHDFPVCQITSVSEENTLADYKRQIIEYFDPLHRNDLPRIKRQIKHREKMGIPIFVVFHPHCLPDDSQLLDDLRKEFETLTFFFLTGDEPAAKTRLLQGKVRQLEPLDRQTEIDACDIYDITRQDLKNMYKRKESRS